MTSKGAIRFYYPDFVAIQKVDNEKIYWILETKGREFPELENKNNAVERWCRQVTEQTGKNWKYLMIKQSKFTYASKTSNNFSSFLNHYLDDEQSIL